MNYSFINNYKNKDFIKQDPLLYRDEEVEQPNIKNYYVNSYGGTKNNWATEGSIQKSILKSVYTPTPLGEVFFSLENINRLQKQIKKEIFIKSNGKYKLDTEQNESDLLIVMRAVYISDAVNSPYKIIHQVKELNHKTIERIIPDMLSIIKQDQEYLNMLDKPINVIPLPVNVSNAGRRSLPSVTTTFFYKK
jgi:hypothetical protein